MGEQRHVTMPQANHAPAIHNTGVARSLMLRRVTSQTRPMALVAATTGRTGMPRNDEKSSNGLTSSSTTSKSIEIWASTRVALWCKLRTSAPRRWALLARLAVFALASCSTPRPRYPYRDEPDPRGLEYVIGISDEVAISVWKNRELDARLAVRPDGSVTLPLIGDVRAAGLTPSELRHAVASRLAAFVVDREATVTVAVLAVNSYFVTVAGSVATPGRIASKTYLTVAEAIALAGGPTRFADAGDTILLRRTPNGGLKRIPIDYERIIAGKDLDQNLVLFRGDRIYVP